MNIYIKMQESVLKRADPDFNPMLKAKLGRIGGDIWIVLDAFAYCIPQKMFLLSDVGFGEFTSNTSSGAISEEVAACSMTDL